MVGRLVEEQKIRLHHEQPREMRAHDPAAAQCAGRPRKIALAKSEPGENPFRFRLDFPIVLFLQRGVRFAAGQLEDGLLARRRGLLREIAEGGIFLQRDLPQIRRSLIQYERKKRRLPGPVRPDQPDSIAAVHLQRYILKENAPGERFGNLRNSQHRGKARTFGSPAATLKP